MSFIAFEISLNGERLYTVGAEEWRTVWAHILGHRITPDTLKNSGIPDSGDIPEDGVVGINLRASVSIPGNVKISGTDGSPQFGDRSKTRSYSGRKLNVGDVVTIKIVETDVADEADGPEPDPRFTGATIAVRKQ